MITLPFDAIRDVIHGILIRASNFEWSVQGMGMLRLHVGNTRIHIWDDRLAYPGVSMIHDHLQWGLHSTIINGRLRNVRYVDLGDSHKGDWYMRADIKAGYGGGIVGTPKPTKLAVLDQMGYLPGDSYMQAPHEIHETQAECGTVTLMHKEPTADKDAARVWYPMGTKWGSAEPRAALDSEVLTVTQHAVSLWG